MKYRTKNQGFTLLELIVSIVILGLGVTAFTSLINQTTRHSIDPMIIEQANAIAQSYLEEVMLRPFCDPDWDADANPATPTVCPTDCTSATACTTCSPGATEGSRTLFDDVCDYNDPLVDSTSGARDQNNTLIGGLGAYNINVTVVDSGETLDSLSSANGEVLRIDVNVTHDSFSDLNLTLTGYRTNF